MHTVKLQTQQPYLLKLQTWNETITCVIPDIVYMEWVGGGGSKELILSQWLINSKSVTVTINPSVQKIFERNLSKLWLYFGLTSMLGWGLKAFHLSFWVAAYQFPTETRQAVWRTLVSWWHTPVFLDSVPGEKALKCHLLQLQSPETWIGDKMLEGWIPWGVSWQRTWSWSKRPSSMLGWGLIAFPAIVSSLRHTNFNLSICVSYLKNQCRVKRNEQLKMLAE